MGIMVTVGYELCIERYQVVKEFNEMYLSAKRIIEKFNYQIISPPETHTLKLNLYVVDTQS
jgi:hypothetical protein